MAKRNVAILGVGMTRFGSQPDRSIVDLGVEAIQAALLSAGVELADIEAVFCGNVLGGMLPGQRVLREFGASALPITNVENACASAGTALHHAINMVSTNQYDLVLALGVEKLSALGGGLLPQDPTDVEVLQGTTLPAGYAMRARRYMHEYGLTPEQLALVPVKSHKNAALNPYAHFNKPWTVDDVLSSRMVADPLNLFMCCPNSDGAAAAVVCSAKAAARHTDRVVKVAASVLVSGVFRPASRDLTVPETTVVAAHQAYEQAAIYPEDLDMVECHDAFAIAELLYYETLGLTKPGGAVELLENGDTAIDGKIPVNPSGGLMARGHPVGATGLAQVAEAFWQLRGEAGARQVSNPKVALTHVTGGGISSYDNGAATVHIFAI